jgi:hypothetical protein
VAVPLVSANNGLLDASSRLDLMSRIKSLHDPVEVFNEQLAGNLLDLLRLCPNSKRKIPDKKFPVSLRAASNAVGVRPYEFARLINGRKTRKNSIEFSRGHDYILSGAAKTVYMTSGCFAKAALKIRKNGAEIRKYIDLINRASQSVVGSTIPAI